MAGWPTQELHGKCHKSSYDCGIALPDILAYYRAAHLVVLNELWFGNKDDPAYSSERWALGYLPLQHLLYGGVVPCTLPPVTNLGFKIWRATLRNNKWEGQITAETLLWVETVVPQVAGLRGFRSWDLIGISTVGDVMQGNVLKTFTEIRKGYDHNHQSCQ